MKAYGRNDENLTVGYFLNKPSISDVKFANLGPFGSTYMDGMTSAPPPPPTFLLKIFKGDLAMIAYAKFN